MWSQGLPPFGWRHRTQPIIHASKFFPPQKFRKVRYALTKTEYVTKRRIMMGHHNHLLRTYSMFTVNNSNAVELRL